MLLHLLRHAWNEWRDRNGSRLAAALAYFGIFALAPLLIVTIEIGARLLGGSGQHHVVENALLNAIRPAIGDDGAKAIASMVAATFSRRSNGLVATILSWLLFAVAATGFLGTLDDALQALWGTVGKGSVLRIIANRAIALGLIAAGAALVAGAIVFRQFVHLPTHEWWGVALSIVVQAALLTLLIAAFYKFLVRVPLRWRDALGGGALSALFTLIGQYAIGWYLTRVSLGSVYGAAGTLVAMLVWMFYTAQAFLFGAVLTKAFARVDELV